MPGTSHPRLPPSPHGQSKVGGCFRMSLSIVLPNRRPAEQYGTEARSHDLHREEQTINALQRSSEIPEAKSGFVLSISWSDSIRCPAPALGHLQSARGSPRIGKTGSALRKTCFQVLVPRLLSCVAPCEQSPFSPRLSWLARKIRQHHPCPERFRAKYVHVCDLSQHTLKHPVRFFKMPSQTLFCLIPRALHEVLLFYRSGS